MAKILILEDSSIQAEVLKYALEKEKHTVEVFQNANDAIKAIKKFEFDLIISDIEMPIVNGFSFRESVIEEGRRDIPFIFLTSREDKEAKIAAWNLDIDSYITKPLEPAEIRAVVESILHRKKNSSKPKQPINTKEIFLKSGGNFLRVKLDSIFFIQAFDDYIIIHTAKEKIKIHYPLKEILLELPETQFAQIHRSYIIRLDKIQSVNSRTVKIFDQEIPIGNTFKDVLWAKLKLKNKN